MPDNLDQPSHALMRVVAAEPPYAAAIGDPERLRARILPAEGYYDLLAAGGADVDVWRTTYHHVMADAAAIVDWLRSTGLKPFVDALPADLRPAYVADYTRRIDAAYPVRADGRRLLGFPRLFVVARRAA